MQVVVFTKNNARILKDPPNLEEMLDWSNAIIDPDLSDVFPERGPNINPMYWKPGLGNRVARMTAGEMLLRESDIMANGVDNEVTPREIIVPRFAFFRYLGFRLKRLFRLAK